ncbi:MAG: hypothetical protein H6Q89_5271, partial [Myxococcaceae bacterium]|nr:hypothetical protein [Myxococcaceae bacterium]
ADFHGYGVTCATAGSGPGCLPSFISASFDKNDPVNGPAYAKLIAARNIADDSHCMTQTLRAGIHNFQPAQFLRESLEYELGTLIATSLYQASAPLGKEDVMQKALIDSLDDADPKKQGFRQIISLYVNTPQNFTPELMANTIAAHIPDLELRKQVCKQLWTRLDLDSTIFPSTTLDACATAVRGTFCPVLAQ